MGASWKSAKSRSIVLSCTRCARNASCRCRTSSARRRLAQWGARARGWGGDVCPQAGASARCDLSFGAHATCYRFSPQRSYH